MPRGGKIQAQVASIFPESQSIAPKEKLRISTRAVARVLIRSFPEGAIPRDSEEKYSQRELVESDRAQQPQSKPKLLR